MITNYNYELNNIRFMKTKYTINCEITFTFFSFIVLFIF